MSATYNFYLREGFKPFKAERVGHGLYQKMGFVDMDGEQAPKC